MKLSKFTRYFLFLRVDPKPDDYVQLVDTCERIDAHMGYKTVNHLGKRRLCGFLVLRGQRAFLRTIHREFPNFQLIHLDGPIDWDSMHRYDFILGDHPYLSIRKTLFP